MASGDGDGDGDVMMIVMMTLKACALLVVLASGDGFW